MRVVSWSGNSIIFNASPNAHHIQDIASGFYTLCVKRGYKDIVLDFSRCTNVFENVMLPTACLARFYLVEHNVDIEIKLPTSDKLRALFHNSNWQHLISPRHFDKTTYSKGVHVPALQYTNGAEQHEAVDNVMSAVLASLDGLTRGNLKALEWSISEITDNVLNHAQSKIGGFVQVSTFGEKGTVEFIVADMGIGISRSLKINDPKRALEQAVKEGVTRDKDSNAGNGLFGSLQVATMSGGQFQLHSGNASLIANEDRVQFYKHRPLYPGVVVIAKINCMKEGLLEKALRFKGEPYLPAYDYVEAKYEKAQAGVLEFRISEEVDSLGSREAAKTVKTKLLNLVTMNPESEVHVDFSDVYVVSSSFADEVFGKIFHELGPVQFMNKIRLVNIDKTIRGLLDRAIVQRSASSYKAE